MLTVIPRGPTSRARPLGESDQRRLAHRIERDAPIGDPLSKARADRDDAASGAHTCNGRLGGEEDGASMYRQRLVEVIERNVLDRTGGERCQRC